MPQITTPQGANRIYIPRNGDRYQIALAIESMDEGPALNYATGEQAQPADVTLLLSDRSLYFFGQVGCGYEGTIRLATEPGFPFNTAPAVDWWRDAPKTEVLGTKPNFRTGPPPWSPLPGGSAPSKWFGYAGIATVLSNNIRLIPVHDPSPNDPVGTMEIVVEFLAEAAEWEPINYEVCEDLTRASAGFNRFNVNPITPLGLGDPLPLWAQGIVSVRRLDGQQPIGANAVLSPEFMDSIAAAVDRSRGLPSQTGLELPPAIGAMPPPDAAETPPNVPPVISCQQVTSWRGGPPEQWLRARLLITVPLLFGIVDDFAAGQVRYLPLMTTRIDYSRAAPADGFLLFSASGPLAGLSQEPNHSWIRNLMVTHGNAALLRSPTLYAQPFYFSYGPETNPLIPENFTPRALIALSPGFWVPDPDAQQSRTFAETPPTITVETFGPEQNNFAINFYLIEDLTSHIIGPPATA